MGSSMIKKVIGRNPYEHRPYVHTVCWGIPELFGDGPGMQAMEPGSMKGLQLVVADAHAAREELLSRGVEAGEIATFDERDGGTFFGFADPDGNAWAVQQIEARAERPLIPPEWRGRFAD